MNNMLRMETLIAIWMITVLFFPYFPSVLPKHWGGDLAFVYSTFIPLLYLSCNKNSIPRKEITLIALVFFYFLISIIVAIFHDAQRAHMGAALDLLIELVRPIVIFIILVFWIIYFKGNGDRDLRYANLYLLLGILLALLCFLEVYGWSFVKSIFYILYKRDYKEIIANKATGTFGITYYLAFFLLFPFSYALIRFLVSFKFRSLIYALIILGAGFISQSRTAFFAYIFLIIVSLVIVMFFSGKKGFFLSLALVPLVAIGLSYFYYNYNVLLENFQYLGSGIRFVLTGKIDLSGHSEGSANIRIAQVMYAINNAQWFGLFGSGMAKGGLIQLESVYAMYIFRYGFIGLIIFFLVLFFCFYFSLKKSFIARATGDDNRLILYLATTCYFMTVPVMLFSSAIQDGPKTSLFYYGLVALCLITKNDSKHVNRNRSKNKYPMSEYC